jgi:hypothetical protein
MACPNKKLVKAYLTTDEYKALTEMAERANLSISQFIHHACLGFQLLSFEHQEFRLELLQTRSDLGRLGGLLKAALAGGDTERPGLAPGELRKLLAEISLCQRSLKSAVERL